MSSKKMQIDNATRNVNAFTTRLEFPLSLNRKNSPLNRLAITARSRMTTMNFMANPGI